MESRDHFDAIAADYDFWKKKNWYYYENLKKIFIVIIPEGSKVLEIGCGTGDILASLKPQQGLGIDISYKMVELANLKYKSNKNLSFEARDITKTNELLNYPYILMVDVLEHIENLQDFFRHLNKITLSASKIIISVANPLWEPILSIAEKLKLKMPEGPHKRWRLSDLENWFKNSGFSIVDTNYRLLIPKKIPAADFINARFYKLSLLNRLGMIKYWILKKNIH
ncbi:MAG: type 12 methyltransferase [Parcubacteria group bacterium Licking1014_17]|nr:MAG: type 12 methyltransferase [Parcubacteria group bacterium Licking1014_17]